MPGFSTVLITLVLCAAAGPPTCREGVQAQQSGNHRAAVALFTQCIAVDASHGDSYYRRALSCLRLAEAAPGKGAGLLDSALSDINQALGLDTANASAHNLRGLILLAQGLELEPALESFTAAIKCNPRYVEALRNRARAYRLLRRAPKAIGDLSVAIGLAPHDHAAFTERAGLYTELGQCSLAVGDLTSVLAIISGPYSPESEKMRAETFKTRADCLVQLGQYGKALSDYRAALPAMEKNASVAIAYAWADRAAVMEREGSHETAAQLYTNALDFKPDFTLAYAGRARARYALGHFDKALADCDTVLMHNPDSYLDLMQRGLVCGKLGLTAESSADFARALEQARSAGAATDSLVRAIREMSAGGVK